MAVTQLDVAKEALAQIGTRSKITALNDGSAEAAYLTLLYNPIRDFLLTEGDYDWSMSMVVLTQLAYPGVPWNFSYAWPPGMLRLRQAIPSGYLELEPTPIAWNVIGSGADRVINSGQQLGWGLFTGPVAEDLWDGIFRQSFVRMLSSALAFALENRIEASKVKLDEALGFAGVGKMRDI